MGIQQVGWKNRLHLILDLCPGQGKCTKYSPPQSMTVHGPYASDYQVVFLQSNDSTQSAYAEVAASDIKSEK